MNTHQNAVLVRNLVESTTFEGIINEIKAELFREWTDTPEFDRRERIYNQAAALDLLVETIISKAQELTSGDTNG